MGCGSQKVIEVSEEETNVSKKSIEHHKELKLFIQFS